METSYIATEEQVMPRGINYLLLHLGYGTLGFLGFLGSLLVDVFDEHKVPRWAFFLVFLALLLLLGRLAPSMSTWSKRINAKGILVYSDSPVWKNYIESRWLPAAGDRIELINISEGHHWKPSLAGLLLEAHLANRKRPLLPVALIISERPILLAFHGSFLDYEAGDNEQLKSKEQLLARALGASLA